MQSWRPSHPGVRGFDAIAWQVFILRSFETCDIGLAKILARLITAARSFVGFATAMLPPESRFPNPSYSVYPTIDRLQEKILLASWAGKPTSARFPASHLNVMTIKRDFTCMNTRVTPLRWIALPTGGPSSPCKQALSFFWFIVITASSAYPTLLFFSPSLKLW